MLPLGIRFRECSDPSAIPFEKESFDLIINRHGDYDASEIYRLLRKGGIFVTEQVGGDNDRDLVEMVLPGTPVPFPLHHLEEQSRVFEKAGFEPSYCVGGIIPELDTNAKAATGKHFIAELDESDGTIVKYSPEISVINNLEIDHVDFYTDGFESLLKTFKTHLSNMKNGSKIIINNDNDGTKQLMARNPEKKFITFGLENADYTAKNIHHNGMKTSFDVCKKDEKIGTLTLSVPGKHNVYNALAVCSALLEDGIDFEKIRPHFETFTGMGRRFQTVCEFGGIKIIDDYAHHPSEIKTTLESAKNCAPKRLVAIFQPHRYSRLQGLWGVFLKAFESVDKLFVVDIYAASEDPIEGVSAEKFAKEAGAIYAGGTIEESAKKIAPRLESGDMVITLGAGDITKIGKLIEDNYKISVK